MISIHAPRAGSDQNWRNAPQAQKIFQSTLPVRGATGQTKPKLANAVISIHAPRAGSDLDYRRDSGKRKLFQSTLPVRGATGVFLKSNRFFVDFNPRSPCGERRLYLCSWSFPTAYFNPRSPCGERLDSARVFFRPMLFQSTLPVRGATDGENWYVIYDDISIHAPRAGSDFSVVCPVYPGVISIHAPRAGSDLLPGGL